MLRSCLVLGFALFLATGAISNAAVDFNAEVRPILSDRCYTCHGPDKSKRLTTLRLDTAEGAFAPLPNGQFAIVRGKPQESVLIRRISSQETARRMPPGAMGHAPLSEEQIETLTTWVREGAPWTSHWAFQAPRKTPATVESDPWIRNAIDGYVLARLKQEGLEPSAAADRSTLLRRITLDLTGLPPAPDAVQQFLSDDSPDAYEKVVERLLASPRYGERMAFRWLEAARYADTNGYQNDQERDMWRWRDWVIEAFNSNMGFDQFTIEQLAGDLLPEPALSQLIATGFNRNHRGNAENGTDPDEYQVEYAVDRLETTSMVWLGLTMGCARCHDHKYDPISQLEFYKFFAYFNNVDDRGRYYKYGNTPPVVHAPTRKQQVQLATLDDRIGKLRQDLEELEPGILASLDKAHFGPEEDWTFTERLIVQRTFDLEAKKAADFDGQRHYELGNKANFDFYDPMTLSAWIKPAAATGGIIARYLPAVPKGYGLFLDTGKLQLRIDTGSISDRMRIESLQSIPLGKWTHVSGVYDGSRTTMGMQLYINGKKAKVRTIVDESLNPTIANAPLRIGYGPGPQDRFQGKISDARVYSRALSSQQAGVISVKDSLAEISAIPREQRTAAQQDKLRWAVLDQQGSTEAMTAWQQLRKSEMEREDFMRSLPTVMVMRERQQLRPTHLLFRGSFDAPGEQVEQGLPAVLPSLPANMPNNRLGLAHWLTDQQHPLTSRVTVNRFWQMLFGRGIVSTVEDFGSQGAPPSHPKLLDWLAVDFIESGWDIKHLLQTIVTSATYRQSSKLTTELFEKDPENLLLARAPRQRLPAESIRDQALSIAGLLSAGSGGPSVKPYQPTGLWKELSNWKAYENDHGKNLYSRSLYTFWKRTLGPPAMLAFDASPRETCVVQEVRTNTPIQALNLMNDPTYNEAARLYAERMLLEGGDNDQTRLSYGFLLATARQPAESENRILLSTLNRYRDRYLTTPEDAGKYLSVGEHPRNKSIQTAELAAYTAVASMLLNLDETITRE